MEHETRNERGKLPTGVKTVVWLYLALLAVLLLGLGIVLFILPDRLTLAWCGHPVHAEASPLRTAVFVFALALSVVFALPLIFALRGHMWAYVVLVFLTVSGAIREIMGLMDGRINVLAWIPFLLVWLLYRDYDAYREYAGHRPRKVS